MSLKLFLEELESNSTVYQDYRKHCETLLKYSVIEPNIFNLIEIAATNPISSNKTAKFLYNLADKYKIKIIGEIRPFWIGPSITKKQSFFRGLKLDRLIKWYERYGCVIEGTKVIREPK